MFCAAVAYPIQQAGTCDFDFVAHTRPSLRSFARRALGEIRGSYKLSFAWCSDPNFLGGAYFWVRSGEDFGTTLASYGNEI